MPIAGAVGIEPQSEARDDRAAPAPSEAPGSSSPPDWSSITETFRCPLCRYDLRGLIEPRCPECGYRFDWPDLLNPARREHPYLFEQHPERNLPSFFRTLFGHLRPRRFWRSIRPEQPVVMPRLVRYWLLIAAMIACAFACYAVLVGLYRAHDMAESRANAMAWYSQSADAPTRTFAAQMIKQYGSLQAYIDTFYPGPFSMRCLRRIGDDLAADMTSGTAALIIVAAVAYLTWPWASAALTMAIFRISIRRARIAPPHLARVMVYCCDVGAWLVLVIAGCMIVQTWRAYRQGYSVLWVFRDDQFQLALVLAALLLPVAIYRQAVAFRLYLKLDHAVATALAVQLVLATALTVAIIAIAPLQSWVLRGFYHL